MPASSDVMCQLRIGKSNESMIYYRIICLQWWSSTSYLNEKKTCFLTWWKLGKRNLRKIYKIYQEVPLPDLTKEVLLELVKIITCFDKMMKLPVNKKYIFRANLYLFKFNNRNTRKSCEICLNLTIKTPERRRSGGFIVNFEYISHPFLVVLLLNLNK